MAGDAPTPRVRRDVQSLIDGGPEDQAVLNGYVTAIRKMRQLDEADGGGPPTNPLSWRFQAAMHKIAPTGHPPHPLWNRCEHSSWLFLPWHRIYIYRFERIIQHHLGDETWSLPYWDYTKGDEGSRRLPLPFREPAEGNPLFVGERVAAVNAGEPLPAAMTEAVKALARFPFALDASDARSTFGGGKRRNVAEPKLTRGALENVPHGMVHSLVGGEDLDPDPDVERPGWMARFATAALDPIFWLHHCNLDRLWEVWVRFHHAHGHPNPNPDDEIWLATSFPFADTDGSTKSTKIREILDVGALGYRYESLDPPPGFAVTPAVTRPSPELVGAIGDVPFAEPVTLRIELEQPRRRLEGAALEGEETWHLRVENIQADRPGAVAYAVHLNVEGPGAAEGLGPRVGLIAAFGLVEESTRDEDHDGQGITDVFEITEAVRELEARGGWDAAYAIVTIVPLDSSAQVVAGGDVRAERISIYRG